MPKFTWVIAVLVAPPLVTAAEFETAFDIPYVQPRNDRQILDIYFARPDDSRPVMVWLHGGGWRMGDKRHVHQKPQAFFEHGIVFVSANYRFVPDATMDQVASDVATAIKWVHRNIDRYGGDRDKIFLGGHSAGAHLAALVSTDGSYLRAAGLSLANISACIPVDTAMYDAPLRIGQRTGFRSKLFTDAFGEDEATQASYSPLRHVAADKQIPPFLILHVADREASATQSRMFEAALRSAGVSVQRYAAEGKNHLTINRELGDDSDAPTRELFRFLSKSLQ